MQLHMAFQEEKFKRRDKCPERGGQRVPWRERWGREGRPTPPGRRAPRPRRCMRPGPPCGRSRSPTCNTFPWRHYSRQGSTLVGRRVACQVFVRTCFIYLRRLSMSLYQRDLPGTWHTKRTSLASQSRAARSDARTTAQSDDGDACAGQGRSGSETDSGNGDVGKAHHNHGKLDKDYENDNHGNYMIDGDTDKDVTVISMLIKVMTVIMISFKILSMITKVMIMIITVIKII